MEELNPTTSISLYLCLLGEDNPWHLAVFRMLHKLIKAGQCIQVIYVGHHERASLDLSVN
jgi:hypothetical protein